MAEAVETMRAETPCGGGGKEGFQTRAEWGREFVKERRVGRMAGAIGLGRFNAGAREPGAEHIR